LTPAGFTLIFAVLFRFTSMITTKSQLSSRRSAIVARDVDAPTADTEFNSLARAGKFGVPDEF
jgi:hypothetical protein